MKKFKPNLAIDATDHLDIIKYPKLASEKLDGIRCVFHPEKGIISRSLKPIQNKQLVEKLQHILEIAKEKNCIFDGELYDHDLNFQEITALVMTQDFMDPKTIKKLNKDNSSLLKYYIYNETEDKYMGFQNPLYFCCFDCLDNQIDMFWERNIMIDSYLTNVAGVHILNQKEVNSPEEVKDYFKETLDHGFEGLILRDPDSKYKFGRSTLKEEGLLKVKPFETFDAEIIEVIQATEVDPNVEKTINELGRSVTSKKKDDRILIEKASAFRVKYEEYTVKVVLAMTDSEKEYVWNNKESYIGRMIEYKGMQIGSKDVPRHPVFIRFRDDK